MTLEVFRDDETPIEYIDILRESTWAFGELMAVMHGDGGHYLEQHGVKKSLFDAMKKYNDMRTELDEVKYILAGLDK